MAELTQRDIAQMVQVSQATVSRVLNNDPRVKVEVRDRVMAVVHSHDYVPDSRAQSLRAQRSGTLGLVVHRSPDQLALDPFFSSLIVAILQVGSRHGFHLCVDTARTLQSQRTVHEDLLRTRRVDGLILVESSDYDERIARLIEGKFPFVLIGRYSDNDTICSVDNDNVAAGRTVVDKLISDGHRRIAYLGGPKGVNVSEDRLKGYRQALEAHHLGFDNELVVHSDFTAPGGRKAMERILTLPHRPDAVLAVDDVTAAAAMRVARSQGIAVPDEMAFVGFNDSNFCDHVDPPLTSVSIDINHLAAVATETLIDLIEERGCKPGRIIVPCRLIERRSTRR